MEIVKKWFELHVPSAHHCQSYAEWQHFGLLKTLRQQCVKGLSSTWTITHARLEQPELTPQQCVERGATYDAKLLVTWRESRADGTFVDTTDFCLARVPMIVWPHDAADGCGGYFVVKGTERVLVTQLRGRAYNQPVCRLSRQDLKKHRIKAEQNSFAKQDTVAAKTQVRSMSEASGHSCESEMLITRLDQMMLESAKFKGRVGVGIVMKMLGLVSLMDFQWACGCNETARILWLNSLIAANVEHATQMLMPQLGENPVKMMLQDVWPHLGLAATKAGCCKYMGSLAERLVRARREKKGDNIDAMCYKRFSAAGHLIGDLQEQILKRYISQVQKSCGSSDSMIVNIHGTEFITNHLIYSMSQGQWGAPFSKYILLGVSQPRCNMSGLSQLAHVRRCSNPQSRETKNLLVRQLDASERGYTCPLDSPEGEKIGIVKNLAISCIISRHTPPAHILDALLLQQSCPQLDHIEQGKPGNTLWINGRPCYLLQHNANLISLFLKLRREGWFDQTCSIGQQGKDVYIWCDAGRLCRPVWEANVTTEQKRAAKSLTWNQIVKAGYCKLVDPHEQEHLGQFYKHQELDEGLMFGISAATIPLINFQPPVRGLFGASMIKQAVSIVGPDQHARLDTTMYCAHKVEKPLVVTELQQVLGLDNVPGGRNVLVAIHPFDGDNQEDALVVNQSSVDRGLFCGMMFKTHSAEEDCTGLVEYKVELPKLECRQAQVNYCGLQQDGLPAIGAKLEPGDAVIGYTVRSHGKSRCCSLVLGREEQGTVVRVLRAEHNGRHVVKVVVQQELQMISGDKAASRYSQKGICGKIVPASRLLFAADGTVPDVFFNPLSLPSRMTLTTMIEGLFGLDAISSGQRAVLNAFEGGDQRDTMQQVIDRLNAGAGTITMYDPITLTPRDVYVAPFYMMSLAHYARPKCYARDTGVRSKLKRQPTDGRSRQGGLRFGEMDRDACITMPGVLDDRLFWSSDAFFVPICKNCKQVAINRNICLCGSNNVTMCKLAFTNHMVLNLMRASGCRIGLHLERPLHLAAKGTPELKDEENILDSDSETTDSDSELEDDTIEANDNDDYEQFMNNISDCDD